MQPADANRHFLFSKIQFLLCTLTHSSPKVTKGQRRPNFLCGLNIIKTKLMQTKRFTVILHVLEKPSGLWQWLCVFSYLSATLFYLQESPQVKSPWSESMNQLMRKLDQLYQDIEEALSASSSPADTPCMTRKKPVRMC